MEGQEKLDGEATFERQIFEEAIIREAAVFLEALMWHIFMNCSRIESIKHVWQKQCG